MISNTLYRDVRRLSVVMLTIAVLSGCSGVPRKDSLDGGANLAGAPSVKVTTAMLALPELAFEAGNYAEALQLYRDILARDPSSKEAKLGIADCELATNQVDTANQLYQELGGDAALRPRVLQGRGIALMKLGRKHLAENLLRKAVTADATLSRAWIALAVLYDTERKWDDADRAYAKALAVKPNSAIIHNDLGFSLLSQGKTEQAVKSFQTALQLDPSLKPARMNLRIALALEGRYSDAVAGVQGSTLATTLNNVGFAAMTRGDYANAKKFFTRSLDTSSSYEEMASRNLMELKVIADKDQGDGGGM